MNTDINKATITTKRQLLSDAVTDGWITDFDLDSNDVFIERWDDDDGKYKTYKHSFTMTDTKASVEEEGVEVIRTVEFKEIEDSSDEPVTKSFLAKTLEKFLGKKETQEDIKVIKQFGTDNEPMFAIEPLYIAPGEVDGHGDTMALEDIEEMVISLNKANAEGRLQSGLFHKHKTDVWHLEKAWVNPVECKIGDSVVPEGQPIAKTVFTNEVAFQKRIDGELSGLSIGARAKEAVDLTKDLSSIQSRPEAIRVLKGVHFDWEHPELTYTSPAQGGAASLKNEAYNINKAKKAKIEDLDETEVAILKEIGEEFVSLEKHLGEDNNQTPSSSSEDVDGEENQVNKGNDPMTEVTREEFEELQKALSVEKAKNALVGYAFEEEINKAVADAFAELDDAGKEAVVKAFDALIARGEAEVEKAKAEVVKPEEENELSKALSQEVGDGGEVEEPVAKSLAERAVERQTQRIEGAK